MTDEERLAMRRLYGTTLSHPDLQAMRRQIRVAYSDWMYAAGRAGRCLRSSEGATDARALIRVTRAYDAAEEQYAVYTRLSAEYETARARMLADAGLADWQDSPTAQERAAKEDFDRTRLQWPPIGWGTLRWRDRGDRIAAWRARPADDRLRDPSARDCD